MAANYAYDYVGEEQMKGQAQVPPVGWNTPAAPVYQIGGGANNPRHNCPLTTEDWACRRKSAKILFTCLTVPLPILPIANLAILVWLLSDINKNPGDYKDIAKTVVFIAMGIGILILAAMVLAVVLGLMGVYKKKPTCMQIFSCLMIGFAVLYVLSGISSVAGGSWAGVGMAVFMVGWMVLLFFYGRSVHLRRMQICPQCY